MAYTCQLHDSIEKTDLAAWHEVVAVGDDPYMDPRFIRTIERSLAGVVKVWTVLVYDEAQRPVAAACLSLVSVDAASMAGPLSKRLVTIIRRAVPRYLYFRVLFCGLPASAGQSQLRIVPGAHAQRVVLSLDNLLRELGRRERARAIIIKEFDREACRSLAPLEELGFVRAPSVAAFELPADGRTFDEYCQALKSHYRSPISRSQRKFRRSTIRIEHVRGDERFTDRYTDEFHRLYYAVLERAPIQIDVLPADYFRELARQFGQNFHAALAYDGGRPVGFLVGVFQSDTYYAMFVGLAYELNRETDLYFNLLYESMAYAMSDRVRRIDFGPDSERFKARLGCQPQERSIFIRVPGVLGVLFRAFSGWMFPPLAEPEQMNAFKPAEPAVTAADGAWSRVDAEAPPSDGNRPHGPRRVSAIPPLANFPAAETPREIPG